MSWEVRLSALKRLKKKGIPNFRVKFQPVTACHGSHVSGATGQHEANKGYRLEIIAVAGEKMSNF